MIYSFSSSISRRHRARAIGHISRVSALALFLVSCGDAQPREPDLPQQPDRWVTAITVDTASKVQYIGKTRDYLITTVSSAKELGRRQTITVGDEIDGIRIGAIKCSFHWRDASYGGEQYMWRGRWGCQAGRSRNEIENAVTDDGEKRFDYVLVKPVTLTDSAG